MHKAKINAIITHIKENPETLISLRRFLVDARVPFKKTNRIIDHIRNYDENVGIDYEYIKSVLEESDEYLRKQES